MAINFWDTLADLYNNDVGSQVRRTAQEVRTAHKNFTRACTRYTKIINEVILENVFETTRSTYDGRYNLKYGTPFIAHDEQYRCGLSCGERSGVEVFPTEEGTQSLPLEALEEGGGIP